MEEEIEINEKELHKQMRESILNGETLVKFEIIVGDDYTKSQTETEIRNVSLMHLAVAVMSLEDLKQKLLEEYDELEECMEGLMRENSITFDFDEEGE